MNDTSLGLYASIAKVQKALVSGQFVTTDTAQVRSSKGSYSYQFVSLPRLLAIVVPVMGEVGLMWYSVCESPRIESPERKLAVHSAPDADHGITTNYTLRASQPNNLKVVVHHVLSGDELSSVMSIGGVPSDFREFGGWLTYCKGRLLLGLLGIAPDPAETESVDAQITSPPPNFNPRFSR